MGWFKRIQEGITTRSKREVPDGVWYNCKRCKNTITTKEHELTLQVCPKCGYHKRLTSAEYFHILFDEEPTPLFENLVSTDTLHFSDVKPYTQRLEEAYNETPFTDAIAVATGTVHNLPITIAAMDFTFIGGSMGSVVGERIARAIDYCIQHHTPLLIISKSGGARMMESAFSLMQMAKTSAKLTQLAKAKLPYLSLLTDPTTGGVTASYAMLGDVNFAEPEALIGFAGPRVIKETIKKELPKGFQTSEFLLEHGFLDFIVERKNLKNRVGELLHLFKN